MKHSHLNSSLASHLASVTAALLISGSAFAGLLTLDPNGKQLNGVAVSKGAAYAGGPGGVDATVALSTVAAGTRTINLGLGNLKVYVAQLMVSEPAQFQRSDAGMLDTCAEMNGVAMRLDFLFPVSAAQLKAAFRTALDRNHVDLSSLQVKALLDAVSAGGGADRGHSITFLADRRVKGTETVVFENSSGVITPVIGPAGFAHDVFSMWLGVPADKGVEKLKSEFLAYQP